MSRLTDFGYAQARLQAHYAALPDEAMWRQAEGAGVLPHFLQNARRSELGRWLGAVSPQSGPHEAEHALRQQFRQHTAEVARWHPPRWHGAILWTALWVDLPLLEHLVRGNEPLPWMEDDPVLRKAAAELRTSGQVSSDSPLSPLLPDPESGGPLGGPWLAHWRTLWPDEHGPAARHLEELARGTLTRLRPLGDGRADSSEAVLEAVGDYLAGAFRRWTFQPAAGVAYLGLVLLTLHRLRANIAERTLFADESAA